MPDLEVVFEVPSEIATGLASGSLQRVGGVIVDNQSKQVVAWLREGTVTSPVPMLTNLGSTKAGSVLAATAVGGIMLNLALTAISLVGIFQRLDGITQDIKQLGEEIHAEFDRERLTNFRAALSTARDVFESENAQNRHYALRSAVDNLHRARDHFLQDFEYYLAQKPNTGRLIAAQYLLALAMHAEATRVRCYLAGDELKLARGELSRSVPIFAIHTKELISRFIGKNPAIYLHKSIQESDVKRFLHIQRWLRADDLLNPPDETAELYAIINDLRSDFWQSDLLSQVEEDNRLPAQLARTSGEVVGEILGRLGQPPPIHNRTLGKTEILVDHLNRAETLVENYERLIGFDLELQSMPLFGTSDSFETWHQLVPENKLKEHGLGVIVDRERLLRIAI